MKFFRNHPVLWVSILSALAVLIVIRLMLPRIIRHFANEKLQTMEGYVGHVGDIDLDLWRGAYEVRDFKLERKGGKVPIPFINMGRMEFSVQWSELVHGALVGDVALYDYELNFVKGPTEETSQTTLPKSWIELTKEMLPFSINRFTVNNAGIHYRDFYSDPKVDIALDKIYIEATNLANSRSVAQKKFAHIEIHNTPQKKDPAVKVDVNLDTFAKIPALDMRFQLDNLDLVRLNDFFRAYGNFDVQSGTFTLLSEMKTSEGNYEGYIKPLFKDMKVTDWKKDIGSPVRLAWKTLVAGVAELLENKPTDRIATQVPVKGNFKDRDIDYWSAILNLMRNAFIQAIQPQFENLNPDTGAGGGK